MSKLYLRAFGILLLAVLVGLPVSAHAQSEASSELSLPHQGVCRTADFWSMYGGNTIRNTTNLTQRLIDSVGQLEICGQTINNTEVGNAHSALEAMCVLGQQRPQWQLARQLTAMALNCIASGAGADCSGTNVAELFRDATVACADDSGQPEIDPWIDRVACLNNGGMFEGGACTIDLDNSCQDQELDDRTDIFAGVSPLPGPAGSPRQCSSARGNGVKVVAAL